jgi:N-acetylneuraminic acid mutarotase
MNRLDKKQIFIGTILGIILSILTLILLTRNIQPLSAQQTTQKYTTFKTDNQGFKFLQRKLTITGAYYEGENTKTNYGSARTSDIGRRYYLYEMTGEADTDRYPRLSCDTNNSTVDCPNRFFESTSHFTSPPQYAGDTYRITSGRTVIIKQKVYTFREPVIVKPIYREETNLAPIFAQTPTETSPGNQVATKEYVDSKGSGIPSGAYVAFPDPNPRPGFVYTGVWDKAGEVWTTKAPMPTPRSSLAAAVVNNKIYAIGGFNYRHLSTNEVYDPSTNTWLTKAPMPTKRSGIAAAVVNNIIYVIGGYDNFSTSTNEAYDPSTDTWSTKARMPTRRTGLAVAVVNKKIYAIGGFLHTSNDAPRDYLSTNEVYDPSTDSWSTKAPMPTPRAFFAAAVVNNKIYIIGGFNNSGHISTNEVYDPSTDTWSTKAPMPTARSNLAAAVVNNIIYAIGGLNGSADLSTNEAYNPGLTLYWFQKQ